MCNPAQRAQKDQCEISVELQDKTSKCASFPIHGLFHAIAMVEASWFVLEISAILPQPQKQHLRTRSET
jgi:hypothetical protein